ncbi:MAG: STAS/SEC14 domain-containing protein [Acidobacteria bacterium]|nr:STAS/SEC14 domain-containing protein [Acidobacteriota bacterium]MBI3425525.1 STAS/SEC14 domain-containing protein [Acidobacteriota bacterium]
MEPSLGTTTSTQLIKAAEQLSLAELECFTEEIIALRARRNAPLLPAKESPLFKTINQTLTVEERTRLAELGDKRVEEALTPDEQRDLLALQQKLEALHAARMKALADLAALRGITLTATMDELGIHFPDYL